MIIIIVGCFDVTGKRYKADDIFRAAACVLDHLYWDETTQVHGTVVVKDFSGYSLKNHNATPVEDRKAFLQTWKVSFCVFLVATFIGIIYITCYYHRPPILLLYRHYPGQLFLALFNIIIVSVK